MEPDNIQEFIKDGYKTLMEAIKHSNNLPQGSDWNFYNTHQGFVNIINKESINVLKQINTLLRTNHIEGNINNRGLEEKTELLVEGNDNILERVANNIDEMNGIKKTGNVPILMQTISAELPVNGSWNRINDAKFSVNPSITPENNSQSPRNAIRLLTAKNIIRPQTFFKDKIVNSSSLPWEPRIKEKPNSMKPLALFVEETERGEEFSHPYEYELDRFTPLPEQLQKEIPIEPLPVDHTPLIEVTEPSHLYELVETLRNCKEFAVDVEHHSYRTFMGITCLMQISTREKDYLVDTLALRDKLWILNEVFTKPTIVKIFHGADMDIQWLQRDLSIYVVNMFDTYQAAKQLEYSGLSLAYLLQKFCEISPNKQFQLADWRIRPLPEELKRYAREDTHYLIYIYQMLKNELLDKANGFNNILLSVINNSTEICKKRYFRPVLTEDSHMDFYRKCKRLFDNRQLYALKELYRWRDQISREEDESTGYVLPNHMLLQIAGSLPREMQGVLACCNPIPPLVRANLLEIHKIILKAKEQPLEKPIFKEDTRARGTTTKISKLNVDSPLNCPHDLTKVSEFRDDLPTILGRDVNLNLTDLVDAEHKIESNKPIVSVFHTTDNSDDITQKSKIKEKLQSFKFLGPFERYKLVKPYIQAEEEILAKEKEKENSTESSERNNDEATEINASENDETKTDSERIESLRQLFLNLSKKGPPNAGPQELDRPLTQMGGTKRKREPSPSIREQSMSVHPVYLPMSNSEPNNYEETNNRKRKSSDNADGATPRKFKKNQKKQRGGKANGNQQGPKRPKGQKAKKERFKRQQTDDESYVSNDYYEENEVEQDHHQQRDQNKFKNKNKQNDRKPHRNFKNRQDQNQKNNQNNSNDEDGFTPYDYSSVDFRQLQGGAGSVSKPKEFKSTMRFKSKKKGNKGNNRSTTFGTRNHDKGRGRGR